MKKIIFSGFMMMLLIASCKSDNKSDQKFLATENIDSSISPADNFYMFVNGKWYNNTTIAASESSAGAFLDIYNRTKDNLKTIFTDLSKEPQKEGTVEQQVADFYASGMDSTSIDKLVYEPVKPYLKAIDEIKDVNALMKFVAEQQTEYNQFMFGMWVGADEKNSAVNLPTFYQGGIGLPDRDYYFKTDAATLDIIKAYKNYVRKLFTLTGTDSGTATTNVDLVYNLEKQIATEHLTNVELRNPQVNYNKMAVASINESMKNMGWMSLLKAMKVTGDSVNISQPKHFKNIDNLLTSTPISTWQLYLKSHLLNQAANE